MPRGPAPDKEQANEYRRTAEAIVQEHMPMNTVASTSWFKLTRDENSHAVKGRQPLESKASRRQAKDPGYAQQEDTSRGRPARQPPPFVKLSSRPKPRSQRTQPKTGDIHHARESYNGGSFALRGLSSLSRKITEKIAGLGGGWTSRLT
ncbi:hypothetical protein H0H92_008593 [Tricholoma furcatifolium]|nr:hypothetical protein H0H92_008593 [Tricholoma furcatifolium]